MGDVFAVAASAIARMRCVFCARIMGQGERDRNGHTEDGRPFHLQCRDIDNGQRAAQRAKEES